MRRLTTALFARRDKVKDKDARSDALDDLSQSTHTSSTERTDHPPNADARTKPSNLASPILTRPKSRFFLTLVRKPNLAHTGGSSSSSSSVEPSTPEDDVAPAPAVYDTPTVPTTQDSDDDNDDDDDDDDKPLTPAPPPPRTRIAQAQHMPAIAAPLLPPPTTTPALATATITSPPHMQPQQVVPQTTRDPPMSPAAYARALAQAALAPAFTAPPLLPVQHLPLFPRSVNSTRALATSPSHAPLLRQLTHRRVLARLSPERLSPADERCLAPFAGRPRKLDLKPSADAKLTLDSPATVSVHGVVSMSEGLRRWVMRPCFEDRFVVYVPSLTSTDGVKCMSVSGTGLGVAALEYSEALEALAGLGEDDDQRFHAEDLYQNSTLTEDKKRQAQSGATLPFPRAEPGSLVSSSAQTRPQTQTQDQAFPVWAALMGEELDIVLSPALSVTTSSTSLASSGPSTPTSPPGGEPPSVLSGGKAASGQQGSGTSPRAQTQPYKAQPSPLRIEQNMILPNPYSPVKSPSKSAPDMPAPTPSPAPTSTSTSTVTITPATVASQAPGKAPAPQKLGVRFAEDERPERNDNVPLGYVQRIKQKRLEKQRFLAEERARRQQEEQRRAERARMEEEQRKRMERERERREHEEERMRRMYAEELTAARNRREGMRFVSPTVAGVTPGGEYDGSRERRERRESGGAGRGREKTRDESYKRPVYDERRQSEPTPVGARNGSPASSMQHLSVPGARNSSPAPSGSGSQKSSSHQSHSPLAPPPALGQSARSSSAPDVRPRERSGSATTPQAQRASMAGDGRDRAASLTANPWMGGAPMNMGMAMGMPMGMNMNRMSMNMGMMSVPPMQMVVPMAVPVPVPVAAYGMPMGMEPLIPPTPPFVMQQFGYRPPSSHSKRSHEHSSQGQSQRRSHSSSPTPPRAPESQSSHQQHQHHQQQQQQQQPRSQSSSPSAKRAARETFPPSASKGAVRASQGQRAEQTSSSSRSPREYTQMRRSSVDGDLHRMSQVYPSIAGGRSERELSRDRDERRSTRSSSAVPGRSSNHHSSMPTVPASHQSAASRPTIVAEHNSWARPSSGFQILSRPSQSRRQTVNS